MFLFRPIRALFRLIFFIAVICGGVYAYAKYIEPFALTDTSVSVSSPLIPEHADGLTLLAFSDTHFGEFYTVDDFEQVIESINEQSPDIVLFLGDLIDHYDDYIQTGNISDISRALLRIDAPMGKYAIYGNHDYEGGAEYTYGDIMTAGGFTVLKNRSTSIADGALQLITIDELLVGYGNPDNASLADPNRFTLLLCHEPDVVDRLHGEFVDLMISGHTHGGQIHTPIRAINQIFLPVEGKKYVRGLYTLDASDSASSHRTDLFVTTGIGMTKLPLRFASRPEIVQFTLHTGPTDVHLSE